MMADIAAVFHWTPEAMSRMDVIELAEWRDLAVSRWNRMHVGKDS